MIYCSYIMLHLSVKFRCFQYQSSGSQSPLGASSCLAGASSCWGLISSISLHHCCLACNSDLEALHNLPPLCDISHGSVAVKKRRKTSVVAYASVMRSARQRSPTFLSVSELRAHWTQRAGAGGVSSVVQYLPTLTREDARKHQISTVLCYFCSFFFQKYFDTTCQFT